MDQTITLRVPATLDGARDGSSSLRTFLDQYLLSPRAAGRFELAVAEALNNVAEHSGSGPGGMVEVTFTLNAGTLTLVVSDEGKGIDADALNSRLEHPEVPDELSDGGRGILLIRKIMDRAVFSRETNRNVLTMTAKVEGSGQ
jgi:anti-sigma regulatory factor (Ser/Thr protein kinase)